MSSFVPPTPRFSLPSTSDKTMAYQTLPNGDKMPVIGYGTFRSESSSVGAAVLEAIKAGYRHFDLAHVYGNEKEVGEAFMTAFEDGLVKREELFITGKLWNSDHDVEIVPKACDFSLNNLGLEYFDLYLIHFPVCWKHTGLATPSWGKSELGSTPLVDTWRAMEKLVDEGKCRSIGVSNWPLLLLHDLVTQARVPIACNQIEVHAYYTRDSLVNYCIAKNICVVAHTPLGGGVLNKETWNKDTPIESPVVVGIADELKVSPAQVLLRYLLQRGIVVIPKSTKPERIAENFDLLGFKLSDEQMKAIHALDKYISYKTNPNPLDAVKGGPDCYSEIGTDIFD